MLTTDALVAEFQRRCEVKSGVADLRFPRLQAGTKLAAPPFRGSRKVGVDAAGGMRVGLALDHVFVACKVKSGAAGCIVPTPSAPLRAVSSKTAKGGAASASKQTRRNRLDSCPFRLRTGRFGDFNRSD